MAGGCAKYRDELSAFVDEMLPAKRWDTVAQHLAGCPLCREETVAIRELRSTLSHARTCSAPSTSLASRLEAIAGDDRTQPLYLQHGDDTLPSRRRRRRRWALRGVAATAVLAVGLGTAAVTLAPEPRRVHDAVGDAREQFAMQSTAIHVQEAVGAVLLAHDRGAQLARVDGLEPAPAPDGVPLPISDAAADELLARAGGADVMVSGVQEVLVADADGGYWRSDVSINRVAGEGAELVVFDRTGNRFLSSFAPDFSPDEISAPERWDFATYASLVSVAGRPATVLEARRGDAVVARWWLDVASGITLHSERFDPDGDPTIVVGYRSVRVGEAQLPDERTQLVSLSRATTSGSRGWCVGFSVCPYELAGLPLVAYSSTTARGERSMSLVYSDGVQTLTATWVEGVLGDGAAASAMAAAGLPSVEAWQAGRGVVAVTTDGPPRMLEESKERLPGPAAHRDSLWTRLGDGMARLAGLR